MDGPDRSSRRKGKAEEQGVRAKRKGKAEEQGIRSKHKGKAKEQGVRCRKMSSKLTKKKSKKQIQKKSDIWQILDTICTRVLAGFSCVWIFLILVVLPLYFQEGYVHIGSDKSYLFRTAGANLGKILLPILVLWAVCRVVCVAGLRRQNGEKLLQKEDLRRLEMVDVCAALYLLAAVLSYLCTEYRETALWGTRGWYMGLVPQVILVVSYFVLSRFLLTFYPLLNLELLLMILIHSIALNQELIMVKNQVNT